MAIAVGAWILHVAALALAPLSTVQVVLSTGVVMLAVLGDRAVRPHASARRQWVGVAMTAIGLVLLVAHACRRPTATTPRSPSPA